MTTKLFVGGLPWSTDDVALRQAFERFGEVTHATVITDRETGKSRGFGFVSFAQAETAQAAAAAMNESDFGGRTIAVREASDRPKSGGRPRAGKGPRSARGQGDSPSTKRNGYAGQGDSRPNKPHRGSTGGQGTSRPGRSPGSHQTTRRPDAKRTSEPSGDNASSRGGGASRSGFYDAPSPEPEPWGQKEATRRERCAKLKKKTTRYDDNDNSPRPKNKKRGGGKSWHEYDDEW